MISIKLTTKTGKIFFVSEEWDKINLVKSIDKAFVYKSTLEFKVSWKKMHVSFYEGEPMHFFEIHFNKKDVLTFESIDIKTIEVRKFDIKKQEIEITNNIYLKPSSFSSAFNLGGINSFRACTGESIDSTISFPKDDDYDNIFKMRYYYRGLNFIFWESPITWRKRWDNSSRTVWGSPSTPYQLKRDTIHRSLNTLMMDPIIQQLYLLEANTFDQCHEFNVYKKEKV